MEIGPFRTTSRYDTDRRRYLQISKENKAKTVENQALIARFRPLCEILHKGRYVNIAVMLRSRQAAPETLGFGEPEIHINTWARPLQIVRRSPFHERSSPVTRSDFSGGLLVSGVLAAGGVRVACDSLANSSGVDVHNYVKSEKAAAAQTTRLIRFHQVTPGAANHPVF